MKIGGCWGSEGDLSLFKVFEIFLRGQNGGSVLLQSFVTLDLIYRPLK